MPSEGPSDESESGTGGDAADTPGSGPGDDPSEGAEEPGGPITRRRALAGGGLLALLGIGFGTSHALRSADPSPPAVPRTDLQRNGWVKRSEATEIVLDDSVGPIRMRAKAATVEYENEGLRNGIGDTEATTTYRGETTTEPLSEHLGSAFDREIGVFAGTKIDVTPHLDDLPAGVGRAEVMDRVRTRSRERFGDRLREAGLNGVRQVRTDSLDVGTGGTAIRYEYRGTYPFDGAETTVQGAAIDIPGGEIEIAGHLAVWHDGSAAFLSAGTHPNESYADTVTEAVEGEDLTFSFDLDLSPSSLREEVLGYMRRVD